MDAPCHFGRLGLTQERLFVHCQPAALGIGRSTPGQVEARLRYISDEELIVPASMLGVTADEPYPGELTKRLRGKALKAKREKSC
jgi:hypothetical protein